MSKRAAASTATKSAKSETEEKKAGTKSAAKVTEKLPTMGKGQ